MDFFKTSFWGEPIAPRKIDRIINLNLEERAKKNVNLNTVDKPNVVNYYAMLIHQQ
jgi:hypothetical protein